MCGIAGIVSFDKSLISASRLKNMTDTIVHRGPEAEGFWISEGGDIGFGHRRLCILDLSDAGAQPMHYLNRYTITYNGEIYNYIELRIVLQQHGYTFQSQSDTEVILAAFDFYGKECLTHFDGMFAFALWDEKMKTLFCARDRFGEKPFYFYKDEHQFLFASEMKALWEAGAPREMSNSMLLNYLSLGYTTSSVDSSATFYKDIHQLSPSHYLLIETGAQNKISLSSYWDIDKETHTTFSEDKAIEQFAELLRTSVARRLRSDVALGTSLSGGLDSSTIAALMQSQLTTTISNSAFSAVFPGFDKDETKYIDLITSELSIQRYTTTPTAQGFVDDLQKLVHHHEEPFQSGSVYAQYKVYELAREHGVTVLLDGQGADETLAGYHKYYHWYWQELIAKRKFATAGKEVKAAKALDLDVEWGIRNYAAAFLPGLTAKQLEKRVHQQQKSVDGINKGFLKSALDNTTIYKPVVDNLNDILYFNTMQFGLPELLRYADRNSMAHSREVRLPFLSHELVEFVFSLPSHFKIKDGWTKWIQRKAMNQLLPQEIVWRKDKVGFEPPQKQWMQHPQLQEHIHEGKRKLVSTGILNAAVLDKVVAPKAANDSDNFDFRYLVAACCL
jgi:asparagine synthase (glutamine-hydrolysing)